MPGGAPASNPLFTSNPFACARVANALRPECVGAIGVSNAGAGGHPRRSSWGAQVGDLTSSHPRAFVRFTPSVRLVARRAALPTEMASGGPSLRRSLSRDKAQGSMRRLSQAAYGTPPPGDALRRDLRTTLYINMANIVNLFKSIDGNHDGIVTPEEFRKKLSEIGIEPTDDAEFQVLWNLIDSDKNGSLSVGELAGAIERCARTVLCPEKPPPHV